MVAPGFSIHQATDVAEYHLAGDWRGVFDHKNTASVVMAMLIFVGVYLTRSGAALVGPLITALAVVFLLFSRSKSATALCLFTFALAGLVSAARTFRVRAFLCVAPLIVLNLLSVGTVVPSRRSPSVPFSVPRSKRSDMVHLPGAADRHQDTQRLILGARLRSLVTESFADPCQSDR